MLPFGKDVVGGGGLRAQHNEEAFAGVNGVANFVQKGQSARWHGDTVPPDIEATCEEVGVQAGNEGFVIVAGIGKVNSCPHAHVPFISATFTGALACLYISRKK